MGKKCTTDSLVTSVEGVKIQVLIKKDFKAIAPPTLFHLFLKQAWKHSCTEVGTGAPYIHLTVS